ncbi:carbamate kinase [Candidatus Bathyarchaeota archaeon]|nr:MAG: carbamate kinase [Candidatus Bathyarchaeota archaeon]
MKVLVSLGGNAILQHGQKGTAEQQATNVQNTAKHLARLLRRGERITITHGNGPQVGNILLQNEIAKDILPPMPLDVCGAESQGMVGYMLQRAMRTELDAGGPNLPVTTLITQTLVLEKETIIRLFEAGTVVISAGGGGVPVIRDKDGMLRGVEAVLDKDRTAALLAKIVGVETLLILTDVEKVSINYGKPGQRGLDRMTVRECRRYLDEGQFPAGSMGPKIESAISFLTGAGKRRAVIASLKSAEEALNGTAGTTIIN